jgi:hypothetical protein
MRPLSTAALMHRHNTEYISRWRVSRASLEATGRGQSYRPGGQRGCMQNKKRRKSTILVGRFAGPGSPSVRYQAHRPTEGVQGYDGSHWSLSSGDYRDNICHGSVHCDEIGSIFEGNLWVNTTFACEQHRSVIYQTDQKGLVEMIWDSQGIDKLVVTR